MEAVCANSPLRPKCIYDYKPSTGELYWTNLLTGVQASLQITYYKFCIKRRIKLVSKGL
jgi:hypothetical protein